MYLELLLPDHRDIIRQFAMDERIWEFNKMLLIDENGSQLQVGAWAAVVGVAFYDLREDDIGVVVTPGRGYGEYGEGFVRLSLTYSDERVDEGLRRLREWQPKH